MLKKSNAVRIKQTRELDFKFKQNKKTQEI